MHYCELGEGNACITCDNVSLCLSEMEARGAEEAWRVL